jgi:DNA-binding response OmpR family regulator
METQDGALLIVDDEETYRDMLSRYLTCNGFLVTLAQDGSEALELTRKHRFDLVLLDVLLPGLDGFDVLKSLRQMYSATDLPVIMATACDRSRDVVDALKLGASDYVTKPFDLPVVLARVQTQMALKRSVDQITRLERSLEHRNKELEAANIELAEANRRMKRDLEAAAKDHSKNYVQGAAAAKLFQPPNSTNSWKSFLEWP